MRKRKRRSVCSVMSTYLPPQSTMSSANIKYSGTSFLTPSVIHEYEEYVWAQGRSLVQPHVHVEAVAFACCTAHLCFAASIHVLYQLNIFFWYGALPRASPDLLPRYSIVGFLYIYESDSYVLLAFSVFFDCRMNIASVVLLPGINPNWLS